MNSFSIFILFVCSFYFYFYFYLIYLFTIHLCTYVRYSGPISWTSTGLMPQLLTISLRDRWCVRKVTVRARAVEEMSILFIDDEGEGESGGSGGRGRDSNGVSTQLVRANRIDP